MKYYLDFDRTLFDTPSWKRALKKHQSLKELGQQFKEIFDDSYNPNNKGSKLKDLLEAIATFISTGRFFFMPDELKEFLYPDVPGFLEKYGQDTTIVTFGPRSFLMAKLASATADFPVHDIVYAKNRKGRTIRKLSSQEPGPWIFVDDFHFQLKSVQKWCPHVAVYEIRRNGKPGDGRWPVIHSLNDLINEKPTTSEI